MSFWMFLKLLCSHINRNFLFRHTINSFNQAYTDSVQKNIFPDNSKRISLIPHSCIAAAVSVEASLALPIFLFFTINLLSIINFFNIYSVKLSQLQQLSKSSSYLSCTEIGIGSDIITMKESVIYSPFINSISYKAGIGTVGMAYRKWNGYDLSANRIEVDEEEYVYVTEFGYSYHKSLQCSHLKVSINAIDAGAIKVMRNENGGKYYPCEKCGGNGSGMLFITPEGDRYHSNANCSGLKRNIITIKLSEVGGRTPCLNCGG